MQVQTERLLLRRPAVDDLEAFFEIMSNPEAMRYWSTLPHADIEVTRTWLAQMIAREQTGGQHFVIEHDSRLVGEVGAGTLPEFGFIIHPDFWGRGMASEAATAAIDQIFNVTDTPHLFADVDPRNTASLRVLTRLGFVETGRASKTFMLGDGWSDSIYLTLPRP
jgi:ribosomal-protein-alanine N-acetyltransferase